MHDCGLYSIEDMRPINELRMKARWKLGGALAQLERVQGLKPNTSNAKGSKTPFRSFLKTISLGQTSAVEAQRIATMPDTDLAKAFAEAREAERLLHYSKL